MRFYLNQRASIVLDEAPITKAKNQNGASFAKIFSSQTETMVSISPSENAEGSNSELTIKFPRQDNSIAQH